MADTLTENFTDSDGTLLTAHTSDSGHTWTTDPAWGYQVARIISNRALKQAAEIRGQGRSVGLLANGLSETTVIAKWVDTAQEFSQWAISPYYKNVNNFVYLSWGGTAAPSPKQNIRLTTRIDDVDNDTDTPWSPIVGNQYKIQFIVTSSSRMRILIDDVELDTVIDSNIGHLFEDADAGFFFWVRGGADPLVGWEFDSITAEYGITITSGGVLLPNRIIRQAHYGSGNPLDPPF
jgi:hypothetical protein